MGLLAAGVAHEINNPLTYVLYYCGSLAEDLPVLAATVGKLRKALVERIGEDATEEIVGNGASILGPKALVQMAEAAAHASLGTHRIREIARGLTSFARVEKAGSTRADVKLAAEHALAMAHNEIRSRAVLQTHFADAPKVAASETALEQVFLNLIINSAHAIDEGAESANRIFRADLGAVRSRVRRGCGYG